MAERPLTVLALARSTSGFYFGGLLAGLNREVAAQGGRLVVAQTVDPNDEADRVVQQPRFDLPVAWDDVDGAVTISLAVGAPLLGRLRDAGRPVVLTHAIDGFTAPIVLPNNHGSAFAAVEHLVAHGHRRIAWVGSLAQADLRERFAAYREALALHGLPHGDDLCFSGDERQEAAGRSAADRIALAADRPTAVVASNDHTALGLLEGLRGHGLRVPEDVAVVGFDDMEAGVFARPSLSSMSLQFEDVGALAGRLVLAAIRGERVPEDPQVPATAVLARRESCGCGHRILAPRSGAVVPDASCDVLAEEVGELLQDAFAHGLGSHPAPDDVAGLAAVGALVAGASPTPEQSRAVLRVVDRLAPRPELLHRVANALVEHVGRCGPAGDGTVPPLVTALWHRQAEAFLRRSHDLERLLSEQLRIASGLLHTSAVDPRDLAWLSGTHVRAGVLALWSGDPADGRLQVAGVYDPQGALHDAVGDRYDVRSFPPRALVDLAVPADGGACFVVPVGTGERQWGLLALVGDIDPTSSQDHYHYWAALLCSAFEEEQVELARRASEQRYAQVARAANDGLWEVDLRTRVLVGSERFHELLDVPAGTRLRVREWLDRIHPDDRGEIERAVLRAIEQPDVAQEREFRVRHGVSWRWVLGRGLGLMTSDGGMSVVGSLSDVHERKELEEQLRRGALYDAVTGLPNRRLFLERLGMAVEQTRRRTGTRYAVIFMDLDGFKLVNDTLGHLVGDELLTVVADRLRDELRAVDTAARFGGDEFAVLLTDPVPDEVLVIAQRIQRRLAEPVVLHGQEVSVTASVGIATSASGYADAEDVLRDADTAMYDAKAAQRGSASVFDREMHVRAASRLRARAEVRTALAQREFRVHYQPVVALDGSPVRHLEALVRWEHPERGLLLPGAFLPDMEDNASIVALGAWVLDEVCRQLAAWAHEGLRPSVSVNVSHQEFWSRSLVDDVGAALARHGVPAEQLVVEITESVIMTDASAARAVMTALRALGVRLHVDDFGTGQSSLHALRDFPVDALKIDGSFVRDLGRVEQTTQLVRIIVEMGQVLGLDVIAECVEEQDQADRLRDMGCTDAQGFLFARALPGPEAEAMLGLPAVVAVG
ncbi:EAL domain-containing protein [Actinotalea sp. AC32]|nr:EAL domain-containing protein [Actinotalea sp. AC32]